MRWKKARAVLVGGLSAVLAATLLTACPQRSALDQLGLLPGNSGFTNLVYGAGRVVALKQGNLAETTAVTAQDRVDILGAFLQTYRADFGAGMAKANDVELIAAAPELAMTWNGSEGHDTVALHQEHMGALVIDAVQYGDFVAAARGEPGKLRRVQGRLFDPALLPAPPASNSDTLGLAHSKFDVFLREQGRTGGTTSVLQTPVIWGEQSLVGFLAIRTEDLAAEDDEPPQGRMAAVVNPITNEIRILYDISACRAGIAMGGGS